MRRLFEQMQKEVTDFIEQRDNLLMLSVCPSRDLAIVLKIMRDIEQASATDVFLLFGNDFLAPGLFVNEAIEHLREEHRMACEALVEEGREPWPQLPKSLFDEDRTPENRLRDAIRFARSLVPREGGHRLVWVMFPQRVVDRRAYLRLIYSLLPAQGVQPWMRGVRLIFRVDVNFAQTAPELANARRVQASRSDFSPEAMAASMEEDVSDEDLPMEQRMQSLFSLAYLDYAHERANEAREKFDLLLGYYQQTNNPLMQALVMNGLGDLEQRNNDLEKSQYWYECASTAALETDTPVVLATVVMNLGNVAYKLGQFDIAEQYYDGWDKLAAHMLDPESKVRALEWRGLSQEKQGAYDRAVQSWEDAAMLCRNLEMKELLKIILAHLQRGYEQLKFRDKLDEVETEINELAGEEATV